MTTDPTNFQKGLLYPNPGPRYEAPSNDPTDYDTPEQAAAWKEVWKRLESGKWRRG